MTKLPLPYKKEHTALVRVFLSHYSNIKSGGGGGDAERRSDHEGTNEEAAKEIMKGRRRSGASSSPSPSFVTVADLRRGWKCKGEGKWILGKEPQIEREQLEREKRHYNKIYLIHIS